MRHGEAAAEDRSDDRLRVAGALAEGPGDRARGGREGVQRARWRQRLVHRGHHLRRRRQRRPGRGVRADDRRRRRRRDGERPGHRRPGRRVGGDGHGEDPPDRVERRPTTTGAIRTPTRSTRPAPASRSCCRRRSSTKDVKKIGIIRVDLAAASALVGLLEQHLQGQGARSPTTSRFRVAPPTSASSSSGAQNAGADGVTLALGEQEAVQVVRAGQQLEHRSARSARASARSRTRPSPTSATSPSRWSSSGRSRRRRPTSPCTRRCAPTSRHRATSSSSPRTSRPARCARGSVSTPCSR